MTLKNFVNGLDKEKKDNLVAAAELLAIAGAAFVVFMIMGITNIFTLIVKLECFLGGICCFLTSWIFITMEVETKTPVISQREGVIKVETNVGTISSKSDAYHYDVAQIRNGISGRKLDFWKSRFLKENNGKIKNMSTRIKRVYMAEDGLRAIVAYKCKHKDGTVEQDSFAFLLVNKSSLYGEWEMDIWTPCNILYNRKAAMRERINVKNASFSAWCNSYYGEDEVEFSNVKIG